jgi:hypothetical protein
MLVTRRNAAPVCGRPDAVRGALPPKVGRLMSKRSVMYVRFLEIYREDAIFLSNICTLFRINSDV